MYVSLANLADLLRACLFVGRPYTWNSAIDVQFSDLRRIFSCLAIQLTAVLQCDSENS